MPFPLEPLFWNWYLLGIVLIGIELLVPGAYIVWFGLAAIVIGVLVQVFGDFHWALQLVAFCFLSFGTLLLGRRFIKKAEPSKTSTLNRRLLQYIGRRTVLTRALSNGRGRVKLDDTLWTVTGPDLPVGTRVVITHIDDDTLVVEAAPDDVATDDTPTPNQPAD